MFVERPGAQKRWPSPIRLWLRRLFRLHQRHPIPEAPIPSTKHVQILFPGGPNLTKVMFMDNT